MTPRCLLPAMRARIAEAIATACGERSQVELASMLGIDRSTLYRRGSEVSAWPLDEALSLALASSALARSLLAILEGETPIGGEPVRLQEDLLDEVVAGGQLTARIAAALIDGRIQRYEAREILAEIERRRQAEDQRLIPDLLATIRGGERA